MRFYIKYNISTVCKNLLQTHLDNHKLSYNLLGLNELEILEPVSETKLDQLVRTMKSQGIEIVEDSQMIIIQKIKDLITEMVYQEDKLPSSKISIYLSEKLNRSYKYISSLFSTLTYTSIENFLILQKTERAKQLIITNELSISEIAWKLNYSSVAHFSTQFKNMTGLTPTAFQRIINKRRKELRTEDKL
jgi:AraC-like DNA-binding protein